MKFPYDLDASFHKIHEIKLLVIDSEILMDLGILDSAISIDLWFVDFTISMD